MIVALLLVWTPKGRAANLYEQSWEKLQVEIEHAAPSDFTFVVLGDSRGNEDIFKRALSLAKSYRPLFILHGGDYSNRGSDKETDHFLSLVNNIMRRSGSFRWKTRTGFPMYSVWRMYGEVSPKSENT